MSILTCENNDVGDQVASGWVHCPGEEFPPGLYRDISDTIRQWGLTGGFRKRIESTLITCWQKSRGSRVALIAQNVSDNYFYFTRVRFGENLFWSIGFGPTWTQWPQGVNNIFALLQLCPDPETIVKATRRDDEGRESHDLWVRLNDHTPLSPIPWLKRFYHTYEVHVAICKGSHLILFNGEVFDVEKQALPPRVIQEIINRAQMNGAACIVDPKEEDFVIEMLKKR